MTAPILSASTLLVAIDVCKHRHEVLIGVSGKKRRRRLTITNTLEDFQRLIRSLASYELPVRIGFEANGNFHRPLAHHLGQAGFELKLISSVGLARSKHRKGTGEFLPSPWPPAECRATLTILSKTAQARAARSLG